MRKPILLTAAAIALVTLVAVPFAFAQRAHRMHAEGFGGPMFLGHLGHIKSTLGLSDQQVSDIKATFKDLRAQNQTYRQAMRGTMQQAAQILIKNPNDVAAAQALLDQQMQTERTMRANALSAAAKALSVLTPDQRSKLGDMLQSRLERKQN